MSVSSVAQLGAELDIKILHIFGDLGNRFINPEPLMITVWTSIYMKAIDFSFYTIPAWTCELNMF